MYIFIWKLMNIRLHMYFVKIDYHHQHEISEPETQKSFLQNTPQNMSQDTETPFNNGRPTTGI